MKKTIVFIVCLGHSGSTLIGNILDSHSKGLHLGEIPSPLNKGYSVVCRNCLDEICPIWNNCLDKKFLHKVYKNFTRRYHNRNILTKLFASLNNYSSVVYRKVFNCFPHLDLIIDSSKNINWYEYNTNEDLFDYKYIFLKRNMKAIYASYKRNGKIKHSTEIFLKKQQIKINELNDFYKSLSQDKKIVLNYEQFSESPKNHVNEICNFLNIPFEHEMMNFQSHEHHLIGGNLKLLFYKNRNLDKLKKTINVSPKDTNYYKDLKGIKVDNRWKSEISTKESELIDKLGINNSFIF